MTRFPLNRPWALTLAGVAVVMALGLIAARFSSDGPTPSEALGALRALQSTTSMVAPAVEGVEEIDGVDLLGQQARQVFARDGLGELSSAEPFDCLPSGENAWTCEVWLTDTTGRQAGQRWLFINPSRGWLAQLPFVEKRP